MNFDPTLPTSYEYIHYTSENITNLDLNRAYTQIVKKRTIYAPNGLWLSIPGINDWEHYCLKNNYSLGALKNEFQVFLKTTAKILILFNSALFEDFIKKYGYYSERNTIDLLICWEKIIRNYQGIVLPCRLPALPNMGIRNEIWFCTSACIWDLQAVEKVEKLGEVNLPQNAGR
jgi:hypothetical protein